MSKNNTSPESDATNGGRANGGRFANGNPGGPGNPFARKVAALRAALINTVTEQDMQDIVNILLLHAKGGDLAAIKLLFSYVIGKPQPAVDPDRLDVDEMRGYLESAFPPEVVAKVNEAMPLRLLLGLLPLTLAAKEQTMADFTAGKLDQMDEKDRQSAEQTQDKTEPQAQRAAADPERRPQRSAAEPSPNGGNGKPKGVNGRRPPSPNGPNGSKGVSSLFDWLRELRTPPNGHSQS